MACLRNCWTCGERIGKDGCGVIVLSGPPKGVSTTEVIDWIVVTHRLTTPEDPFMPPRDADGCPGWAPESEVSDGQA